VHSPVRAVTSTRTFRLLMNVSVERRPMIAFRYDRAMDPSESPQLTLGAIIRRQRELAELPMRQFAEAVGISNPYLSQIERGLRAPSEAVLEAIADSLHVSANDLYAKAGYVGASDDEPDAEEAGLMVAIGAATELTSSQRKALREVYRGFLDANAVRRARKPKI